MTMAIDNSKPAPALDAALRWIGDLDHPFYEDERQRFVWYEASAIGFQLLIIIQFLLAGILMLVLGSAAVPYLAVGLLPTLVATMVPVTYAHRRGAEYFASSSDLRRSRGWLAVGLVLLWLAGLIRIGLDGGITGDDGAFGLSLIIGGVCGMAAAVGAGWWAKRKHEAAEIAADDD